MKKILIISLILAGLIVGATLVHSQTFGGGTGTIEQLNSWKVVGSNITPVVNTNGLQVPSLANLPCIGTNGSGTFVTGTCTGGGGSYPFTPATNYGVTNQATTGIAWFQNGMNASSTSHFVNASTTALTVSGGLYNPSLSDGCVEVASGLYTSTGVACGSGSGGGSSHWATSTNESTAVLPAGADSVWVGPDRSGRGAIFDVFNAITVADVTNGAAVQQPGGNFDDSNSYSLIFDVYAYKNGVSTGPFSSTPETITFNEVGSIGSYYLELSWDAVAGADGYKVVIQQDDYNAYYGDYYLDAGAATTINYGDGTEGGVVNEAPMVLTPTSAGPDFRIDGTSGKMYQNGEAEINGDTDIDGDTTVSGQLAVGVSPNAAQVGIKTDSASTKGLSIKLSAGQTANAFEVVDSSGTAQLYIDSTKQLAFNATNGPIYFGAFASPGFGRAGFSVPFNVINGIDAATMRFGYGGGGTHFVLNAPTALLEARGKANEVQLEVRANGTQTANIMNILTSGGTSLLAVTGAGNLGLGTTTPGTLLSLGNTGANTINISPTATSTFGSGLNIRTGCYAIAGVCIGGGAGTLTGTGFAGMMSAWTSGTNLIATSTIVGSHFIATSSTASQLPYASSTMITLSNLRFGAGTSYNQINDSSGALRFIMSNPGIGTAEIMTFDAGNRVGIGSTTPKGKLTIQNTGSQDSFIVEDETADSTPFVIDLSGNTGIGTTTPFKKLSVVGETFVTATTTTAGLNVLNNSVGTSTIYMYSKTAGFGGQVILEDVDAAGCTSITALNGVLTAATVTCPPEL